MFRNLVYSCYCSLARTKIIDSKCIITSVTTFYYPTFSRYYYYLKPQQTIRYCRPNVNTFTVPVCSHKLDSSSTPSSSEPTEDDDLREDHEMVDDDGHNSSTAIAKDISHFIHSNNLGLSKMKAERLVKKYPELSRLSIDEVHERISYLLGRNVSVERIYAMPWLLLETSEVMESNVQKISASLKLDYHLALPFANFSWEKIRQVEFLWSHEQSTEPELVGGLTYKNRLDYIADKLKCEPVKVANMVAKVRRLPEVPFRKIVTVLNLLLDGGVKPEDIIVDPWTFLHNTQLMEERLKIAHDYELSVIKPWMLRTTQDSFEGYIIRCVQERALMLGHPNLKSFLQTQLKCTEAEADLIMFKVPAIKTATAIKLHEMITYLISKGYTTKDIIRVPRSLAYSKETIGHRIMKLTSMDQKPITLSRICRSSKKWEMDFTKLMAK